MSEAVKIMPARAQAMPIADVDEMKSTPVWIRVNGRQCLMKELIIGDLPETQRFIVKAQQDIVEAGSDFEKVGEAYYAFVSKFSDDITLDDIKSMNMKRLNALINLIMTHVFAEMSGMNFDDFSEAQKKKILMKAGLPESG